MCFGGETLDRQRLVKPLRRPGQERTERVGLGLPHRGADELGLATVPVRRYDDAPGGRRSHLGAVLPPHEVELGVDAGSGARAGQHVPVENVEHVSIDLRVRKGLLEDVGVAPVGGAFAPVQQAGVTENERNSAVRRPHGTTMEESFPRPVF